MIVSTKGRYALRVMVRFAQRGREEYIPLKEIAEGEEISQKYLESIMTVLSKAGFVDAAAGKGGGYRLNRSPEEYTVGEILNCIEDNLAPVACIKAGSINCDRSDACLTVPMWKELDDITNAYLATVTLTDLLTGDKWKNKNY